MSVLCTADTATIGAKKMNDAFLELLDDPELIEYAPGAADTIDVAWGKCNRNFARLMPHPAIISVDALPLHAMPVINANFLALTERTTKETDDGNRRAD